MNCIVSEEDFLNNKYDEERFNKDTLKNMKNMNLDSLHDYLSEAFEYVNIIRDQQCIIAFGNTGCGKSTMFNSLIYGSENIHEVKIEREYEVPLPDGTTKKRKRKIPVIDVNRDKIKNHAFKVGHNQAQSETFLPSFYFQKESGNVYVDMAGLHDSNGEVIKLINWIITKQIFNIIHSFHLIVPITIT